MTKKEEMAYDIANFVLKNEFGTPVGQVDEHYAKQIAKELYGKCYRKIPVGTVFLSSEQRNEEMKVKFDKNKIKIAANKDFAEKVKDKVCKYLYSTNGDGHTDFVIDFAELCKIIDELLEENEDEQEY